MGKLINWMIKIREKELEKNQHRMFHNTKVFPCRSCKRLKREIKELNELLIER